MRAIATLEKELLIRFIEEYDTYHVSNGHLPAEQFYEQVFIPLAKTEGFYDKVKYYPTEITEDGFYCRQVSEQCYEIADVSPLAKNLPCYLMYGCFDFSKYVKEELEHLIEETKKELGYEHKNPSYKELALYLFIHTLYEGVSKELNSHEEGIQILKDVYKFDME